MTVTPARFDVKPAMMEEGGFAAEVQDLLSETSKLQQDHRGSLLLVTLTEVWGLGRLQPCG